MNENNNENAAFSDENLKEEIKTEQTNISEDTDKISTKAPSIDMAQSVEKTEGNEDYYDEHDRNEKSDSHEFLSKLLQNKANKIWLNAALILSLVFLTVLGFTSYKMINNNSKRDKLLIENSALQQDLNVQKKMLLGENQKYAENILFGAFDRDQLHEIAKDNWSYSISVNNNTVSNDNNKINSSSSTVTIKFTEKTKPTELPEAINKIGRITKGDPNVEFTDVVILKCNPQAKIDFSIEEKTDSTIYTYKLTDVPVGDIITVITGNQLAEAIGLDEGYFEVFRRSNTGQ